MMTYGGQWVQQHETGFGQGLLRLSEIAEGNLTGIAKILGQAIIQETFSPFGSIETPVISEPADSVACLPNSKQSSGQEPDSKVLAESEAYLRGDFSFADLNPTPTVGQSFTPGIPANQFQPTPIALATDQTQSINPEPTPQPHALTASDCLDQGNKPYNLRRYEEALTSYNQALSLQPNNAT